MHMESYNIPFTPLDIVCTVGFVVVIFFTFFRILDPMFSYEMRVLDLTRALEKILVNFDDGPEGCSIETSDNGVVIVGDDLAEAIEQARIVLDTEEGQLARSTNENEEDES